MEDIKLYTDFRSTAAFRVRIALNLKRIDYDPEFIDGINSGDVSNDPGYSNLNPQGVVPTLMDGQRVFAQSLAIIEYLDEMYPARPLLPPTARDRARVRSIANMLVGDIHPLNTHRVLGYLGDDLGHSQDEMVAWCHHWIDAGFKALDGWLADSLSTGTFCHGDTPTLADVCLVPQVHDALEGDFEMSRYPGVQRIYEECMWMDAFQAAAPEKQSDNN